MATISTAIGLDRRSRISGMKISKGFFNIPTTYLPQIIAVFGEANTANQTGLTTTPVEVTSEKEAGEKFGYGSPIHSQMRILRPRGSQGVGGIPTVVFPQITDVAATATTIEYNVTGNATANGTVNVYVNGRNTLDFQSYSFSVSMGDSEHTIAEKFAACVTNVLSSPCFSTHFNNNVTFISKWKGATSAELNIEVVLSNSFGVTFSQTSKTDGTGGVALSDSFSKFGNTWYTMCTNPYGTVKLSDFKNFNGHPDNSTGRYSAEVMKPFVSFFGSVKSAYNDLILITDTQNEINEVTNVLCPAPLSKGFTWEAASNVVYLASILFNNEPHRSVNNKSYPDMPVPSDFEIGDMKDYNNRDLLVKKGCSTVILENGAYVIQDLVTTYHPSGENPLIYSYVRDLMIDFNVIDVYKTREKIRLADKTLVLDSQVVGVNGTIKPVEWKAELFDMFDDLANLALIKDSVFSKESLNVQVSSVNPNRFETTFDYQRTGVARIESTTVRAGF